MTAKEYLKQAYRLTKICKYGSQRNTKLNSRTIFATLFETL